ncbi:MAG: hypothetical protein ACXADS_02980 [Candidatus Thorarchaeota archaeon]|jgi:hypothetical protein
MRIGKHAIIGLLVVLLLGHLGTMNQGALPLLDNSGSPSNPPSQMTLRDISPEVERVSEKTFTTSQDTQDGILNPTDIEETGYQVSDTLRARTDTDTNVKSNVTIDSENGWFANQADIEVVNLRRLYALNGSFDTDTSPWVGSTYDPSGDKQTQNTTFNGVEGYVSTNNTGEYNYHASLGVNYKHFRNTEILWSQTIDNDPYSEDFYLSLDFRLASGPNDPQGDDLDPLDGDPELIIWVHNNGYYLSLLTLDSRNTWYTLSDLYVNLPGAPANFQLEIGLLVDYKDLVLYANRDYDNDGFPDGEANAASIVLDLDDISLVGTIPPGFEEVDLVFHAESLSSAIAGLGSEGTALITNPSFWTQDPLQIEVTSNDTVSFDYEVTVLFHRYVNSSWTTDPSKYGVTYSVTAGQSAELSFFTYVGSSGSYENLTQEMRYPSDWENVTILDPLLNDITSQCNVSAGLIEVPTSLLDRVGWWEIRLESPNYAKDISVQIQDTGLWSNNSVFGVDNITRTQVEIGTLTTTPLQSHPVNITWAMPDETVWASDSVMTMTNGVANSSAFTLGGTNTTAGEWQVEVAWTNGSEIAFDFASFDMYHSATLTPHQASVDTDSGQLITNMVYFVDEDTGDYLMDASAVIEGNWSASTIGFSPNLVRNWWEADFDTSLLSSGRYVVVVNASRPYFENVSCQFVVTSTYRTDFQLTSVGGLPVEAGLYENVTVDVRYEIEGGSGIDGATIHMDYSGPSGGLTLLGQSSSSPGDYSVRMSSSISGTYTVTLTGSKDYHHNESDTFALVVGEIGTDLTLANGTADFTSLGTTYRLVLRYANSTNHGLAGADVGVVDVTPNSGLVYEDATYSVDGYYSILLDSVSARTFTLVIKANLTNHETLYTTFTITVSEIPTVFVVDASTASITVGQSHTIQFMFQDDQSNGLEGASIFALSPPEGLVVHSLVELSGGYYNITVESPETGAYQMAFRAHLDNYQNSTVGFTLIVGYVTMQISDVQGLTSIEGQDVELRVNVVDADTGNPVIGAIVEYQMITGTEVGTLEEMVEVSPGIYAVNIVMPSFEYNSTLRIHVTLDDHELQGGVFEALMNPLESEAAALMRTIRLVFPYMMLGIVAVVGLAGRSTYIRRERERNLEATVVKRRFDDVQSLLGVIVLHKHTGIPIFSKMVKGGIDSILVSGFVSAITSFKAEFSGVQENWVVTPISDIIRTVATENLICAFISLSAPSKGQELRMVEFAETVGFVFDKTFTEPPMLALEDGTIIQFEALFDDVLDGRLLKEYKVSDLRGFPRRTRCIEQRIERMDESGAFELGTLATEMTSCGLEEARVYKMIMEAIENQNLVTAKIEEMKASEDGETDSDSYTAW